MHVHAPLPSLILRSPYLAIGRHSQVVNQPVSTKGSSSSNLSIQEALTNEKLCREIQECVTAVTVLS